MLIALGILIVLAALVVSASMMSSRISRQDEEQNL